MYYPKSQILENLYANPGQFVEIASKEEYTGPYYKTSDGSFYTGKNPQDPPNNQLIEFAEPERDKLSEPLPESYYLIDDGYYAAKSLPFNRKAPRPPITSLPMPTESDYQTGEFERYFLKKANENLYNEVNKKEYELFDNNNSSVQYQSYIPIKINWQLTGKLKNVFQTNSNVVRLIERRLNINGFFLYFKGRFSQYFKYSPDENLFTDGTEYKNKRTGEIYIGPYHIHPNKGPMVGATHVSSPHDFLIPLSGSYEQIETEIAQQPRIVRTSGGSSGGY